jgi:hypothetical protein
VNGDYFSQMVETHVPVTRTMPNRVQPSCIAYTAEGVEYRAFLLITQSPPLVECRAVLAYCAKFFFYLSNIHIKQLHFALSSFVDEAASFNVICITDYLDRVLLLFLQYKYNLSIRAIVFTFLH